MADPDSNGSASASVRYPAVVHLSVIGAAGAGALADGVRAALAGYEIVAPLADGLGTPSGRHRALRVSVEVRSRDELEALDQRLRAVPGVRMVL